MRRFGNVTAIRYATNPTRYATCNGRWVISVKKLWAASRPKVIALGLEALE